MDLQAARARLAALETDEALDHEDNFRGRISALNIVAEIIDYAHWRPPGEGWPSLLPSAEALKQRLDATNIRFFHALREHIRSGRYSRPELRRQFDAYTNYTPAQKGSVHSSPDRLDVLFDGLLDIAPAIRAEPLPADMVRYEPAPARALLDLIDHANWSPNDVFYDVGSGLGRAVILVHLLTGQPARGVEIDPAFCEQARQAAQRLNLTRVEFIRADAREVNFGEGTVFFLFTPFKASVWREVLDKLRRESQQRTVRICTLGPCTFDAAQEPWLVSIDDNARHTYKVALFRSRESIVSSNAESTVN